MTAVLLQAEVQLAAALALALTAALPVRRLVEFTQNFAPVKGAPVVKPATVQKVRPAQDRQGETFARGGDVERQMPAPARVPLAAGDPLCVIELPPGDGRLYHWRPDGFCKVKDIP